MDTLDAIDVKILTSLQAQGDLTNLRLSELIGLSPSPCLQRVRRLRSAGYIRGFTAIIDTTRLFSSVIVYTKITLSEQTLQRFTIFENAIQKIPEVLDCSLMSGEFNYFLRIISRDLSHFNALIQTMIEMDIGIKTFTFFVEIRNVKRSPEIPLASLMRR